MAFGTVFSAAAFAAAQPAEQPVAASGCGGTRGRLSAAAEGDGGEAEGKLGVLRTHPAYWRAFHFRHPAKLNLAQLRRGFVATLPLIDRFDACSLVRPPDSGTVRTIA